MDTELQGLFLAPFPATCEPCSASELLSSSSAMERKPTGRTGPCSLVPFLPSLSSVMVTFCHLLQFSAGGLIPSTQSVFTGLLLCMVLLSGDPSCSSGIYHIMAVFGPSALFFYFILFFWSYFHSYDPHSSSDNKCPHSL